MPKLTLSPSVRLRWGEWIVVALMGSIAAALAIEAMLASLAAAWFGDPGYALVPLGPLCAVIVIAALMTRLLEVSAALARLAPLLAITGAGVTALALTHSRVFPTTSWNDSGWLATFSQVFNLDSVTAHTELGIIVLSLILWIVGERLTQHGGEYDARRNAFWLFFILMIVAIILGTLSPGGRDALGGQIALMLPAYVMASLLMLAQVRLAEMTDRLNRNGKLTRRVRLQWMLTSMGAAVLSMVLVLALTAVFFSQAYVSALAFALTAWGQIVTIVGTVLIYAFFPLAAILAAFFQYLYSQTHQHQAQGQQSTPCPPGLNCQPGHLPTVKVTPPSPHQMQLIYLVTLLIVLLIVALIALLVVRRVVRGIDARNEFEETRESLNPRLLRQERRAQQSVAVAALDLPAAGTVRAAYRKFLQTSAAAEIPREPDETPADFARRVQSAPEIASLPEAVLATASLTHSYEDERYGDAPPTPGVLTRAQAAVRAIAAALRMLG